MIMPATLMEDTVLVLDIPYTASRLIGVEWYFNPAVVAFHLGSPIMGTDGSHIIEPTGVQLFFQRSALTLVPVRS